MLFIFHDVYVSSMNIMVMCGFKWGEEGVNNVADLIHYCNNFDKKLCEILNITAIAMELKFK